jgi:hypothetical protein
MNNSNGEAAIVKRISELYKTFYGISSTFPKKDRYSLGVKCENCILDILEIVVTVSSISSVEKYTLLIKASVELDVLKILLRTLNELRVLDNKQYIILQSLIQEIGKMMGGWLKFLSTKNKNSP